jgi:hypothetical protein
MKSILHEHFPLAADHQGMAKADTAARASTVNRTHRVVRERARLIAARRSRVRSLWIPLTICSAFLLMICYAVWTVLDGYELTQIGVPDASDQFLILFLWFFPLSMALLVMVWFRRTRGRSSGEAVR